MDDITADDRLIEIVKAKLSSAMAAMVALPTRAAQSQHMVDFWHGIPADELAAWVRLMLVAGYRRHWHAMSPERRKARMTAMSAAAHAMPRAQRVARAKKAWVTRRRRSGT